MTSESNKAIVQRSLDEGFNGRQLAVIDELGHPNFEDHNGIPGQLPGPAGVKQQFQQLWVAFPDIQATVDDIFGEGDRIFVRTTLRGTQTGQFGPFPPTGRAVTLAGMSVFRIEGGKIRERWALADELRLMQQLGVIPGAGQARVSG